MDFKIHMARSQVEDHHRQQQEKKCDKKILLNCTRTVAKEKRKMLIRQKP